QTWPRTERSVRRGAKKVARGGKDELRGLARSSRAREKQNGNADEYHGMEMAATAPHIATSEEDTMARLEGVTGILGLCTLLTASFARAESSPYAGRWQRNRAHSTPPPGAPVPEELLCDIARTESSHVQWSITTLTAEAQPYGETSDVAANGEFSPI